MKVAQYRDWISHLSDSFASLRSATTPEERNAEARRVWHNLKSLQRAECKRRSLKDIERAEYWIKTASNYLLETGLMQHCQQMDAADSLWCKMCADGPPFM